MKAKMKLWAGGMIVALTLGTLWAPLSSEGQQPAKSARIGFLLLYRSDDPAVLVCIEAFRQGLRQLGYVEGQNITIEYRFAEERLNRLPELAAELVLLKVDVLVSASTPPSRAAKEATSTIPIVMASGIEPVGAGLVASLARPGGNVTGVSSMSPELTPKRLELLKEIVPGLVRVAVVWNPANPATALDWRETQVAAQTLKIQLQSLEVRGPDDFDRVLQPATRERPQALIALSDAVITGQRKRLVDFAAKSRLPAMFHRREFVDSGGLIAYGVSFPELYRRAASYVDKILKGAKPADLPVEQATRFELVVNLKTAKALGLTIPPSILVRADQVIQ